MEVGDKVVLKYDMERTKRGADGRITGKVRDNIPDKRPYLVLFGVSEFWVAENEITLKEV